MGIEEFRIGWLMGSLLLIQLETAGIVGILVIEQYFPRLRTAFDLLAIVAALIFVIGHIKTTVIATSHLENEAQEVRNRIPAVPNTPNEALRHAANPLNNLLARGFLFRFAREFKYIRQVANFNFFRA
jgi:hypothetical protein